MKRRHFMTGLAAAPLATGLNAAHAGGLYWKPARSGDPVILSSPATAWPNAFREVRNEYECELPMRVPSQLRGVLYRNGPALMKLGDTSYHHWLDGDGMVHAFRFEEGRLRHRAKLVATSKLQAEQAAGRRLAPGFGTSIPGTAVTNPDAMNAANISTLQLNGELLALWEGGPPYVLDPGTLATVGKKAWSPETAQLPFSAHPRVAPDGTVWSFGYLPGAGALALYELSPQGTLQRQAFVPAPNADMVHDFAITERYLVFVLMPYRYAPSDELSLSFIGHYAWQANQPGYVLVVDKATLAPVAQIACDPIGLFHLGNAWEVGNTVRVGVARYADFTDVLRRSGTVMDNSMLPWSETRWTELEIDLAGGKVLASTPFAGTVEFPRYDQRRTGQPTRYTYMLASSASADAPLFGFNVLRCFDQQTGQVQDHDFGPQFMAEEHVFVPEPGSTQENRGWLVGTAHDWVRRRTVMSIFDATHVAAGPIDQVTLPYSLPLGLHGQFYST